MEILLWLLPAALTTGAAMLWIGWVGREQRPVGQERSEAARRLSQERFAAAMERDNPAGVRVRQPGRDRLRERSTGVAVRRQRPRRSA